MTCQNCGSTDIVKIQGEQFCLNCGQNLAQQLAKKATSSTASSSVESKPTTPIITIPKTQKSAISSSITAKENDEPKITLTKVDQPKNDEPKITSPKITEPDAKPKAEVKSKKSNVAIKKFHTMEPTKDKDKEEKLTAPPRRLNDLAPGLKSVTTVAAASKPVIAPMAVPPPKPAITYEKSQKTVIKPEVPDEFKSHTVISSDFDYSLGSSFETIGSKGARHYGLAFGVAAGIPLAIIFGWLSRMATSNDTVSIPAGWHLLHHEFSSGWHWLSLNKLGSTMVAGVLTLYFLTTLFLKLRALAAISYGKAKQLDRRSVAYQEWGKAARGSEASLVWLAVFDLAFVAASFAAAGLAWQISSPALTNSYLHWTGAAVLALVAVGIPLYALLLSLVALPAVVLTGRSAAAALELAGTLTSGRRFRLMLRLILSLLAVGIVLVAAVALVAAVGVLTVPYLPALWRGLVTALVGFLAGTAAGNASSAILADTWTGRYHILARIRGAESASSLLSGRNTNKPAPRSYIVLIIGGIVITAVVCAIIYIWFGDLQAWGQAFVDFLN